MRQEWPLPLSRYHIVLKVQVPADFLSSPMISWLIRIIPIDVGFLRFRRPIETSRPDAGYVVFENSFKPLL